MSIRFLASALMIFCLLISVDMNAQTGAAKGTGRVKGKITDPDGKPLEGVTVHFANDRLQASFDIKTNEKGEFGVMIAGGMWNVDFIKEGYQQRNLSTQVTQVGYNKPIEISLQKAVPAAAGGGGAEKIPGMDLLEEGNKLKQSKDYQGAIAKYEAANQANPQLHTVYMQIGNSYLEMGDQDKAIEAYQKFLAVEPNNADAKTRLAMLQLQKHNTEEAKKLLTGVDLSTIKNPSVLFNIGVGFYNAGDSQSAIQYWEKTIALNPKMTEAYFQLALAYYANKDMAKAKTAFQKVIELDPSSENAKMSQEMLDTIKE